MSSTKKTAKDLILSLQDAGITNEYVNVILNEIQAEKDKLYITALNAGKLSARGVFMKKLNVSDNFNTQYLKGWLKKADL